MKSSPSSTRNALLLLASSLLPTRLLAANVLTTTGFTSCQSNSTITVSTLDVSFDKDTATVTFNAAGTNNVVQNVTASIVVSVYGKQVYTNSFNPCDGSTYVEMLCPVPAGNFSAAGTQVIPSQYLSYVPAIAFTIPNLDGSAQLTLTSLNSQESVACIQAAVTNDKSVTTSAVSYAAVGIGGAALALSGVSALASVAGAGAHVAGTTSSPSFTEVVGWFQSMAMNGMLTVNYPSVYRSFTSNFGFSTGLVSWDTLQKTIDSFRAATGGNLTDDSVAYLHNTTLTWSKSDVAKRGLYLLARGITTSVNGSSSTIGTGNATTITTSKPANIVHGIEGYVEALQVPKANTFMTVLLVFSILLAAITAGILLFKVILETWALFGTFPKRLASFRQRYWWLLAKTITNLILLLYGVWVLYCVYQFKIGDSWAAKVLAGVTLGLFTALLIGFTWRIYHLAHRYEKAEGDTSALYDNKETWQKYSLFYSSYKKGYWWLFVPAIVYMFAKGCIIAGADGHGLVQSAGQLVVESVYLVLLLLLRPFTLKSGNWINVIIQVVRVISVVCVLVFVDELGISDEAKTVTGVVLIVIQSVLTALLAILILVNAIVGCVKMNPHRKRRKEAEKLRQSVGDLTDLSARNTMLMYPLTATGTAATKTAPPAYNYDDPSQPAPVTNKLRKDPFNTLSTLVSSAAGHARGRSVNVNNGKVYDEAKQSDLDFYDNDDREARAPRFLGAAGGGGVERGESMDRLTGRGAAMGQRQHQHEEEDDGDVGLGRWRTRGAESGFEDDGDLEARRPLRDQDTSYQGRGPWI